MAINNFSKIPKTQFAIPFFGEDYSKELFFDHSKKIINPNVAFFLNGNYFLSEKSIESKDFVESDYFLKDNPLGFGYYYDTADQKDYGFYAHWYHTIRTTKGYDGRKFSFQEEYVGSRFGYYSCGEWRTIHWLKEEDNWILHEDNKCEGCLIFKGDKITIADFFTIFPELAKKNCFEKTQAKIHKNVFFTDAEGVEYSYKIICPTCDHTCNHGKSDPNYITDIKVFIHNYSDNLEYENFATGLFKGNFVVTFEDFEGYDGREVFFNFNRSNIEQETDFSDKWQGLRFSFYNLVVGKEYVKQPILYNPMRLHLVPKTIKFVV